VVDQDYPGGRTDWEQYPVPDLAGFLADNLEPAWTHVRAWYGTANVAANHQQALQRVRDELAQVWPPERNQAAAVYLARLDSMIASLGDVHQTAGGTAVALSGVLSTLEDARRQVDQVHEQWKQAEASASTLGVGEYETQGQPWQVELNQRAQRIMHETDAAVYAYQPRMQVPAAWDPTPVDPDSWEPARKPGGSPGSDSSGGSPGRGIVRPPSIPPVLPLDRDVASSPTEENPRSAGATPVLSGDRARGIEVRDASASPSRVSSFSGQVSPSFPGPVSPGSWMVDTPRGRVLRAGGVIEPSGVGYDERGENISPRSAYSSASPAKASESPEVSDRGAGGLVGGPGALGMGSNRSSRQRASEKYTEWAVRKGVSPVIEPGPEPTHDPGPGVIGIDR
jgi:hypothetical protein